MKELLTSYSVSEIMIFIILLALALKEFITLFDFFKDKIKALLAVEKRNEESSFSSQHLVKEIKEINRQLVLLTESDKDDIRGWIVEKYNYYKNTPEAVIDSFTMDTIEKRYQHYRDEGGNSYISNIIEELRKMAKED